MFSPYNKKIDGLYGSLQIYFNIEDDGELKNYLGIYMDCQPDDSIHQRQPYLTQIVFIRIPGMENSSAKPTPAVKPPLAKNEGVQARKMTLIIDQ